MNTAVMNNKYGFLMRECKAMRGKSLMQCHILCLTQIVPMKPMQRCEVEHGIRCYVCREGSPANCRAWQDNV